MENTLSNMENTNKRALITGIHGQDGSFMAELLKEKGFDIFGLVKVNAPTYHPFAHVYRGDLSSYESARFLVKKVKPTHIFNFAGVSNTFKPHENLDHLIDMNCKIPQNLLQAIVDIDRNIRFFQASSCLVFGHDKSPYQSEDTPRSPLHPYGISKLYVDQMVEEFRSKYGIFACSGIFFNHESERRGLHFFTRKVTEFVARQAVHRSNEILNLNNLSFYRDYGYAPDFMRAVYLMMTAQTPKDYVIGTGILTSGMEFANKCFDFAGLKLSDHIDLTLLLNDRGDDFKLCCNNDKIYHDLGWEPSTSVDEMIEIMINSDIERLKK